MSDGIPEIDQEMEERMNEQATDGGPNIYYVGDCKYCALKAAKIAELEYKVTQWQHSMGLAITERDEIIAELEASQPVCVGYVDDLSLSFLRDHDPIGTILISRQQEAEYQHPIYLGPKEKTDENL